MVDIQQLRAAHEQAMSDAHAVFLKWHAVDPTGQTGRADVEAAYLAAWEAGQRVVVAEAELQHHAVRARLRSYGVPDGKGGPP